MFTALILFFAAMAAGDAAPAGGQDYTLEPASHEIFERFRPDGACGIPAQVEVQCDAGANDLKNCSVVSENPPGKGFGKASVRVAGRYHVTRPSGWKAGPKPETIAFTVDWSGAGGGMKDVAGGGCNGM